MTGDNEKALVRKRAPSRGDYESVEIMSSMANFKRFLTLRDQHPAFEQAKENGYIGIPALLLADEQVILNIHQLKDIFG